MRKSPQKTCGLECYLGGMVNVKWYSAVTGRIPLSLKILATCQSSLVYKPLWNLTARLQEIL